MRKKIIISLSILFAILIFGAAAAILYITNATSQLNDVVRLHQAEHFRKNLLIKAQTVQADVYAAIHAPQARMSIIKDIEELDKAARQCNSCHHPPELVKRIAGIQGLVGEYQAKLNDFIKMPSESKKLAGIEAEVSAIGGNLLKLVRDVDSQAHQRLQERVESAKKKAAEARTIFIAALFLALFFALLVAVHLVRIITRPVNELLKATRAVGAGNLGYTVLLQDKTEFGELGGSFNAMSATLKDNYENFKKQQKRLEESEWKFRTLSEFAHDWEYWVSEGGEIMFVSPSCERITGYTQEEFMRDSRLRQNMIYSGDKDVWERHISDGFRSQDTEELEIRIITKNGEMKWLSHICSPIFVEGKFLGRHVSNRDITDRKKLEEQVMHSQKLESVGTLAGGIAHDFNNILTAITGYGHLLKMKAKEGDPTKAYIEQILSSSERAANLTQSLLAFSRKQVSVPEPVKLKDIVENVKKIIQRLIGENIELRTEIKEEDLTIMADSGQIEQVLVNLCTNARDAMPEGGTLAIGMGETSGDRILQTIWKPEEALNIEQDKGYAEITVLDTGTGMDEKTRQRIFEPFFTTKEVGKGTGLGLSMVYGIIKQHNGHISVQSEKGKGTAIKIYLPLTEITATKEIREAGGAAELKGGTETILLAEDEESVRTLAKTVLKEFGYEVIEAGDGQEAVNRFMENKDRVDLFLTDVIMPGMNGREAYERIKKAKPEVKVLFASGYPSDFTHKTEILAQGLDFISKPVPPEILLKKVREVLDRK